MPKYKMSEIAVEITERENFPAKSSYKKFVGLEHYDSGEVRISKFGDTSKLESTMKVFQEGDVLIARRNVYLKRAGVVNFSGLTSGDSIVLRPKNDIFGKILPFILNTEEFWHFAEQYSDGTMSKRLSPKILMEYEFVLPEEKELETLCDTLWAAYETKESYYELLKNTDELVKSQFIEMFGDPILNTMNWDTKPIKEVAPEYTPSVPQQEKYWWLNLDMIESFSGNIIEKIIVPFNKIGSSTSAFDDTMVLYSKLRPNLNKVTIPTEYGYATTELVGLRPKIDIMRKEFLFSLLRGDEFVTYANNVSGGSQMPRMPMKNLREFQCILPPIDLQDKYIDFVRQTDKSKVNLQKGLKKLENTKNMIIQSFSNERRIKNAYV